MNLRRVLLRTMLISLAIAAVVGALSVLVLPRETSWRIFGTGILTAVTCGFLLGVSKLTDKPQTRAAGLFGMAVFLVEYLLILFLIWLSPNNVGNPFVEQIGFAALFLPAVGIPAIGLLRIAGTPLGAWAGRVGTGLCAIEFLLLMIAARMEATNSGSSQWFATSGACAILFPMLIASLAGLGAAPGSSRRWPAIIASCVCLVISVAGIWKVTGDHAEAYALIVSIPAVLAYLNLAMLCPLKSGQGWVRWVAVLSVATTAACIDCGVFLNKSGDGDTFDRLAAASGIIAGCSTLALAIFAALNRKIDPHAITLHDVRSIELTCPVCKKKQAIITGGAACIECGLRIVVRLEQPECAKCGYLLYHLKSNKCPECGTPISPNDPASVAPTLAV